MKADWKDPTNQLPEQRIRVIVCDTLGYMQTAFYGRQSSISGSDKVAWRTDSSSEKELDKTDVAFWENFPESPYPKKEWHEV